MVIIPMTIDSNRNISNAVIGRVNKIRIDNTFILSLQYLFNTKVSILYKYSKN